MEGHQAHLHHSQIAGPDGSENVPPPLEGQPACFLPLPLAAAALQGSQPPCQGARKITQDPLTLAYRRVAESSIQCKR